MLREVQVAQNKVPSLASFCGHPTSSLTHQGHGGVEVGGGVAFLKTASHKGRNLAQRDCYPNTFYHCSSAKTITRKIN